MRRTLGGFALGAVAFVACPCHLPLTLPLLLAVLGGTSLGALLTDSPQLVFLAAGALFVAALAGAYRLLVGRPVADAATRTAAASAEMASADACCTPTMRALVDRAREPNEAASRR